MGLVPMAAGAGAAYLVNRNKKKKSGPMQTINEIPRRDQLQEFINSLSPDLRDSMERGRESRSEIRTGYNDLRNRPGYQSRFDPSAMRGDIGSLRNFGLRGGHETFGEFAKTGGWDDTRKEQYRSRIASETPAFYKSLRSDLARRQAARGAYAPGFVASDAKLARESARASGDAIRDAELGMASDIDRNRLAGAQGYSQNFLSGLNAALRGETDIQNIGNAENRYEYDSARDNELAGLQGLQSLFGTTDAQSGQYLNQLLAALGMQHDWQTDERDFRYQRGQNDRSWWTNLLTQLAGGAAGALG